MTPIRAIVLGLCGAAACIGLGMTMPACGGEPEHCRFNPDCGGGVGSLCGSDDDCDEGVCCRETANCGGGMCTYPCTTSANCPSDMACEHGVCFFRCADDRDCAAGMSCEHSNTICEWP